MLKQLIPFLQIADDDQHLEAYRGVTAEHAATLIVNGPERWVGLSPSDCRALATRLTDLADAYRFPEDDG